MSAPMSKEPAVIYDRKRVLGRGHYGTVFLGTLDGMEVAVKRIQILDCKPQEENTMGIFDHENVLKLIRVKEDEDFK